MAGLASLALSPAARAKSRRVFQKHYGGAGDPLILVAKGSSREFNATLPQGVVDRAYERDAAAASAEYGAEFRRDIVVRQHRGRDRLHEPRRLRAGAAARCHLQRLRRSFWRQRRCDDAGHGHRDHTRQAAVIDALREVTPPFSPEQTVEQFASLLRTYECSTVVGDKFAGDWPVEAFRKFGVRYEQSAAPKSDLYRDLLASLNSQRVDLLDHPKIISQLCMLERRTSRGGRDSIDHPPGGHDDVANVIAGVAAALTADPGAAYLEFCRRFNGSTDADPDGIEAWQRLALRLRD